MNDCIANELTSTSARGSIHGHIHWDNGRHTDFIYARIVNGEERKADFIEFDGERYERVRECHVMSEYSYYDHTIPEWNYDYCSNCGGEFYDEVPSYCPNCGARVKEVGA